MLASTLRTVGRTATRQFSIAPSLVSTATSLSEPLPGLPESTPVAASGSVAAETTTLPNGVRVVSADLAGHTASIRLRVQSGSRVETDDTAGMAQFLAHAAFKNTSQRSAVKFAMDIEDLGGEFSANATRESVTYSADVLKGSVSEAVGLLAETALDSQFQPWTVETIRDGAFQAELDARLSNVTVVLSEALHAAAFYDNSSLGQPLFSDASGLDADSVGAFVAAYHGAGNIVLAGAGVSHAELVSAATASLGSAPAASGAAATPSAFVGGEQRIKARADGTHVGIAFAGAASGDAQKAAVYGVLATLIEAEGVSAFNATYAETGMFGMYGSGDASAVVDAMVATLKGISAGVDAKALGAAKASLKATIAGADGSRAATATSLASGAAASSVVSGMADAVSAADVQSAAKAALASKPAVASFGSMVSMPHLDQIMAKLA